MSSGMADSSDDDVDSTRPGLGSRNKASSMLGIFGEEENEEERPRRRRRVSNRQQESAGGPIAFVAAATAAASGEAEEETRAPPEATPRPSPRAPQRPEWERHTKGIGFALLQKMGFRGRLGKEEQGMAAPVEVERRPEGLGLGFGRKEAAPAPARSERVAKRKRFFASAAQMRAAVEALPSTPPVVVDLSSIPVEPEAMRLARRLEADLEAAAKSEENRSTAARSEAAREVERGEALRADAEAAAADLAALQRRQAALDDFRRLVKTTEPTGRWLASLEGSHPEAWALCGFSLDPLEASGVAARLRRDVRLWRPLEDPELPLRWRDEWGRFEAHWPRLAIELFETPSFDALRGSAEISVPLCAALKAVGVFDDTSLSPLVAQRCVAGMRDRWAPEAARLLPPAEMARVAEAVAAYWKHHIRQEKRVDVERLLPWRDVLDADDGRWRKLVSKDAPRSVRSSRDLGDLRALEAPDYVVAALVVYTAALVWPRIKRRLMSRRFLAAVDVYLEWRSAADDGLASTALVQAGRAILDATSLALDDPRSFSRAPDPDLLRVDSFDSALALLGHRTERTSSAPKQQTAPPPWHASFAADGSIVFADVVERFAAQHDVLFVPKPGRAHDGKQLFSFNGISMYIDANVTFAFHPTLRRWQPMSLEDLLQLAAGQQRPPT